MSNARTILLTGAAGFIGSSLVKKLLINGDKVIGVDNLNNYYDTQLKNYRLKEISNLKVRDNGSWIFHEESIEDLEKMKFIFKKYKPKIVINLAAQAGVRYSLKDPLSYIKNNLDGFFNIVECCRLNSIENFIYASSSSVYGGNKKLPYQENHSVNHPISLYAATKRSNELIAHSYSHLYSLPSTGLRFFTVYGPWGRPDMAPMIFTRNILKGDPIEIFNFGNMERDFTFINDIVEAIFLCTYKPAVINNDFDNLNPEASTSFAPHRIFNIGNGKSIKLMRFIELLEDELGVKAIKVFKSMQQGDVMATAADMKKLNDWLGFTPRTSIEKGIKLFVDWYKNYYK